MDDKWINDIINANSKKGFVKRILKTDNYAPVKNDDGTVSSHSMAWGSGNGKFFVYPTVVVGTNGKLKRLSKDEARENSLKKGNSIAFNNKDEAAFFSKNYKRAWADDFLLKDYSIDATYNPHINRNSPKNSLKTNTNRKRNIDFDPEGSGYDYKTAEKAGLTPDSTGHWPSRDPKSGQMLKGKKHPTYSKTVEGESKMGYEIKRSVLTGKYYSNKK